VTTDKLTGQEVSSISQSTWIVSFPKSGRTWLKVLLGKALCEEFRLDQTAMLDIAAITRSIGAGATDFSHDKSDLKARLRFDELNRSKAKYADSTVVFLVRDPRDVMVSCYFQATKRRRVFDGSIASFIRDERYGIRKCAVFHRIWSENQHVPRRFVLVRYEDMRRDPAGALRSVLAILDIPKVSSDAIQRAVSFGDFANMQNLESTGYFDDKVLKPGNVADPESFKVRRGEVGGHRDYVSHDDLAYMTAIMAEQGGTFYTAYLQSPAATAD
jgi:hypothetical protein